MGTAILVGKLPAVEDVGSNEELRGMTVAAEGIGGGVWEDEETLMDAMERALERGTKGEEGEEGE